MNGEGRAAEGGEKFIRKEKKQKKILLITHHELCYVGSYHVPALVRIVQVPNLIYVYIYMVSIGPYNLILSLFNLYTVGIQILWDKLLSLSRLPL